MHARAKDRAIAVAIPGQHRGGCNHRHRTTRGAYTYCIHTKTRPITTIVDLHATWCGAQSVRTFARMHRLFECE